MKRNVRSDIARHPYLEAVANMLVEKGPPDCDLSDLLLELKLSQEVVEVLIRVSAGAQNQPVIGA